MKKTTLIVMIVTVIAKLFGFLRDKLVTHFFGFGIVSDAFNLAYGIPSSLLVVIVAALVTGFIPMYTRIRNNDKDEASYFVNNIFNILGIFALILGVIMFLVPGVVVKVAGAGFGEETHALATQFVRIISFSVISIAVVQLGTGYLNVNDSFILPNLIPIPTNIIIIGATVAAHNTNNLNILPYAALLGITLQGVMMFIYMHKFGFRYSFVLDFKDKNLIKMIQFAMPLLISTVVITLDDLFMRSYATVIHGDGGYTYINNSFRLMGFATGLFINGILSVAYPTISHAASVDDKPRVIHLMNDAILLIALFVIPATVGLASLSHEVVTFVYGGGEVTAAELTILGNVFLGNVIGLLFMGLRDLFIRIHYSYQDMKTPLRAQVYYVLVDVTLFLVLGYFFGIAGLTFAASIAAFFICIYLFNTLLNKFKRLGMRAIISDLGKIALSSILMGIVIFVIKYALSDVSNRLLVVLSILAGVLTYFASVWFMKVDLVRTILKRK